MNFLSSCTPDHQPPLLLPVGEEEQQNAIGGGRDFNMDFLKSEGLSQVIFFIALLYIVCQKAKCLFG